MEKINTKVLSGFMELAPNEQIAFDRMKDIIRQTYQQFGFTPLDTPSVERREVLLAKEDGTEEGENQKNVFFVQNRAAAERNDTSESIDSALRFDLTVPLARYVAEHYNDLSFPFRRCQIAKVYRGETAQDGRYREFYQCDIDVVGKGSLGILYDAEIPLVIYQLFQRLNVGAFTIRLNNRKILNGLLQSLSIQNKSVEILRVVDKKGKVRREELERQLAALGLDAASVDALMAFVSIGGTRSEVFERLNNLGIDNPLFLQGVAELKTVTDAMLDMGVREEFFLVDLSIARGLDYYTGTVYETMLTDHPKLGSVCSGGRYDNLASTYCKEQLPGVGISIGLTRLFYKLNKLGLIDTAQKSIADIVVVPLGASNTTYAMQVGGRLRAAGYYVDVLLEDMKIKSKFQYVNRKKPRVALAIGDDETASDSVVLQVETADGQFDKKTVSCDKLLDALQALGLFGQQQR